MADYYSKLSVVLPLPREATEFIRQVDAALMADDTEFPSDVTPEDRELLEATGPTGCQIAWEDGDCWSPTGIWIGGDDANPDAVAQLAQLAIRRFQPELVWGFEWSHDCSKLRLDAFGGGAVRVTAAGLVFFNTSAWLRSAEMAR